MTNNAVSAEQPDWSRELKPMLKWDPSRSLISSIRAYQARAHSRNPISRLASKYIVLRYRFWSVVTGADIPLNCEIGGGLLIPHPNGIVVHPRARIGPNCLIFQQVTIGTRNGFGPPSVGGHVDIGAGAKILGDVCIGDHVTIGANAVVLESIPDGTTAVGIPAKSIGN